jgi:hypothetical protein
LQVGVSQARTPRADLQQIVHHRLLDAAMPWYAGEWSARHLIRTKVNRRGHAILHGHDVLALAIHRQTPLVRVHCGMLGHVAGRMQQVQTRSQTSATRVERQLNRRLDEHH